MPDTRPAPADAAADARHAILRQLGARAHQLRAATRAADHFIALGVAEDTDTGSWLMSCAVGLATELAADIDSLARGLREAPPDAALAQAVQKLRVRAHELHAAARAADHFLDGDDHEDRDTGGWLITCARGLAEKLAAGIDDAAGGQKRPAPQVVTDAQDAALQRRVSQVTAPVRGVA